MGAGVATHYAAAGADHQEDFSTFWQGVASIMSGYVQITVPTIGDTLEVETGLLQSVWTGGTAWTGLGGGSGGYPGGVGAVITWVTATIINGHRVRGRTFIVPLAANSYDGDGTLTAAVRTNLQLKADQLIAACGEDYVIYHRPRGGGDGVACPVVEARVPDRVSSLKSRR